jgi:hypothetical protein
MSSAPFAVITGAAFETWIVADDALFGAVLGSAVVAVTFADATIADPLAAAQSTSATVSVKAAVPPTGSEATVHVTGPVLPGAGVLHIQPAGTVSD